MLTNNELPAGAGRSGQAPPHRRAWPAADSRAACRDFTVENKNNDYIPRFRYEYSMLRHGPGGRVKYQHEAPGNTIGARAPPPSPLRLARLRAQHTPSPRPSTSRLSDHTLQMNQKRIAFIMNDNSR
ncbi:hypothetical protein EVAR_64098_1 [Eumeta japonica]|uniref:Uncharacterized protein n=1 Tax=Eumeta variegata TaxID=151549 RepID=A0A4C1ZJ91_EUMVA|nr:hypothetical protein EVAR_64098_1 [Eumeta japonica]